MSSLTPMDLKALSGEMSPELRGVLASKIATDYRGGRFNDTEIDIANDIFRILLKNAEKKIRMSLANELAHCPQASHDIIEALAYDEAEVAAPVLQFTSVLNEDELMTIVRSTREVTKLRAIARRERIFESLAGCLMETKEENVLRDLFSNKGAKLGEDDLLHAWDSIATSPSLLDTLVQRGGLPLTMVEKIFFVVSEDMRSTLSRRYKLNSPAITKALSDAREWQMLGILPDESGLDPHDDEQVEDLVDDLYRNGRLTYSLMIRALCVGNLQMFETGMAKLAGVPRVNARMLLMDSGPLGFDALYKVAAMPEGFCEAVRTLLRLSFEETQYGRVRHEDFRKRIIERIYIDKYHRTVENMEYLLSIIGGKIAAKDSVH